VARELRTRTRPSKSRDPSAPALLWNSAHGGIHFQISVGSKSLFTDSTTIDPSGADRRPPLDPIISAATPPICRTPFASSFSQTRRPSIRRCSYQFGPPSPPALDFRVCLLISLSSNSLLFHSWPPPFFFRFALLPPLWVSAFAMLYCIMDLISASLSLVATVVPPRSPIADSLRPSGCAFPLPPTHGTHFANLP